jgi:hypothetical protein
MTIHSIVELADKPGTLRVQTSPETTTGEIMAHPAIPSLGELWRGGICEALAIDTPQWVGDYVYWTVTFTTQKRAYQ